MDDCLTALAEVPSAVARLVYIDPPFNTGYIQKRQRRGSKSAIVQATEGAQYADSFEDYEDFLIPRIQAAVRCLTSDGSLFVHLDAREVHYVKVALDKFLGRDHFMNEIIWAYDYGGRSKRRWPAKHNTILWYVMDPKNYVFNFDAMDRIPYMAPGLVSKEKAALGKTPTDVWWQTIVPTNGSEKTGYPTQKPLALLERIIRVHSDELDTVLDCFAGSGTTGHAALLNNRRAILIDSSFDAIECSYKRLYRLIDSWRFDGGRPPPQLTKPPTGKSLYLRFQ